MARQGVAGSQTKAWLLFRSGPLAGTRVPIPFGTLRIGRALDNDLVIEGAGCATVSLYHIEVSRDGDSWRARDLGSTNGTWLNGERITEAELSPSCTLQLGTQGPEFGLQLEDAEQGELDRTIETPPFSAYRLTPPPASLITEQEDLLSQAVTRARRIRTTGHGGQTMTIMRDVIEDVLRHTRRRFRIIGYSMLAALLAVSAVAIWKITTLKQEKSTIDAHIQQLETELEKANDSTDVNRMLSQLGDYQNQAESMERTLLYRLGSVGEDGDFVTRSLHSVMAEFGAEVYSIPPDFVDRVKHYIEQDQGLNRPIMTRALSEASGQIQIIRRILQEEQLPPDLAYIPLVESALTSSETSAAGATGPWQFTKSTAKAYGLRVDGQVDERKDLVKSTRATSKYLRDLILDFGAGSSVMLALAAYDSGTTKVKAAVSRTVLDPIKQRNFWYLYRTRALPAETREYVPKVFAAILIGRNPHHFGF